MAENSRPIQSAVRVCLRFYTQLSTSSSASSFRVLGAFSGFIRRQLSASADALRYYLFRFTQVQFISHFNQTIPIIILLTTFLQLKFQGNDQNKNPFATHPRTMTVAVSSFVVYCLAYIALLRYPLRRFAIVARHCFVSSGYASVGSLASVLLPDSFSPFVYALFVLLSAIEFLYWLFHKLEAEEDGTEFQVRTRPVRRFLNDMSNVVGSSSRPSLLPL